MPMSEGEVFEKVKETLVEALGVDDDEVTPEAKISADLGAESIDYLDITFRLEKAFAIKIPRGELVPEQLLSDPTYVRSGRLTAEGLEELKKRMTHADLTEFEKDPEVGKIMDLFTVQTIVNYVMGKVAA
ncbi:MAG TPA: acyl carrier protein [Phycisphaerae bacterium]|nr:acyl carrier protein [Phycisphaerae bacterium]